MSDINASIVDVDRAMDSFDDIQLKTTDFANRIRFDLEHLGRAILDKQNRYNEQRQELKAHIESLKNELSLYKSMQEEAEYQAQQKSQGEDGQGNQSENTDADNESSSTEQTSSMPDYSQQISALESEISNLDEELTVLDDKLSQLDEIKGQQSLLMADFMDNYNQILSSVSQSVSNGQIEMAEYLMHISKNPTLDGIGGGSGIGAVSSNRATTPSRADYRVVIIDSRKYPESAEHIRACQMSGYPSILTLDRENADEHRKQSLAGIPTMRQYGWDRDEYPPAAFAEGGHGAHVWGINASDNQGSGASFGRQLSTASNGTRVRFRVI